MKLKIHTYISTLFVFLAGCAKAMSKNQTAFEWGASESSTDLYPTKIGRGIFHYCGSEMGVFIPRAALMRANGVSLSPLMPVAMMCVSCRID